MKRSNKYSNAVKFMYNNYDDDLKFYWDEDKIYKPLW